MSAPTFDWHEANQRFLVAEMARLRACLQAHVARVQNSADAVHDGAINVHDSDGVAALDGSQARGDASSRPAIETLAEAFGLSPFERDLLLLCAGVELDASFAALCAQAQGDGKQNGKAENANRAYATFSLALAVLPGAHWSALLPSSPLRFWRLLEVGSGSALTSSPLRIDERVLHALVGLDSLDERLSALLQTVTSHAVAPSQIALAERVANVWKRAPNGEATPVVQLCGDDTSETRAVASAACDLIGCQLRVLNAESLPAPISELDTLLRLWEREALLSFRVLLLDCGELDNADHARASVVSAFIERLRGPLLVATRERRRARTRPVISFDVKKPTADEQRDLWREALGEAAPKLNGSIAQLGSHFDVNAKTIRAASVEALSAEAVGSSDDTHNALSRALWDACRGQARPRLDDLAQRIEPAATWDDLVLPEAQRAILRAVAAHVRQRATVYETWGFAGQGGRGLGISAMFAGASGTGKTMAAEVLASELRLDLYKLDLSSVVSKYIGETEKNLSRIFDAAEAGGAILLFDEADALFGKRSEVKDSHDRYANIEVSYLLQRMESYRGLAILTTNMKSALDTAFLRRIRFVVQFPFPDLVQRAEIWRRVFPTQTPTENLNADRLAQLVVAGGNIRNTALNAAFLAADEGAPVRMSHLLRAAHSEYAKLEKPLTDAEVSGWTPPMEVGSEL